MTEITEDQHKQIKHEQYKIVVVDAFVFRCPYCGNTVQTDSIYKGLCNTCNQISVLFCEGQYAEKYLNRNRNRRELLEA